MSDIKSKVQHLDSAITPKDLASMAKPTGNIYEAIYAIAIRAKQLNEDIKTELHNKLDDFATHTETIEEIHENKEQIEISKSYEKLPNPSVISIDEYIHRELNLYYPEIVEK